MLTRVIRFLKWLFLPETLPPPPEEPTRKAGFFAWLVSRESLDGARFRTVEPVKKKSFFGRLFASERLGYEEPPRRSTPSLFRYIFEPESLRGIQPESRKSRSLIAWLFSREKL